MLASLGEAVWVYQLPKEIVSFNGLVGLCFSVDCVRLGVLWRFSRQKTDVFQMTKNIGQISLPTSVVSVSTENFCKQFRPRLGPTFFRPDKMSGLIWIQKV